MEESNTNSSSGMNPKTLGIIAYLTLIGWVVALVMNNNDGQKDEHVSFHIRQALGLLILSFTSIIPILGILILLVVAVLWIIAIIGAANGEKKPIPILGEQFQEWFKSL